jgi:hypothetical protein
MTTPLVFDVRTADDPSLSFLSGSGPGGKLAENEFAILQDFYGFEVDRTFGEDLAKDGELYWRLYAFELKSGPAVFQPQVWKDGSKYVATPGDEANVAIAYHWPDAPGLDSAWQPQYQPNAVVGWTEGKGDVGFGYSSSQTVEEHERTILLDLDPAYHPKPAASIAAAADAQSVVGGGPFWIWVMAGGGKVGSDCAAKLNWVDNHLTPNPIFQETRKGGGTIPTTTSYLGIYQNGQLLYHVPLVPGAPPGDLAFSGLGYIGPDGTWSWHVPGVAGTPG